MMITHINYSNTIYMDNDFEFLQENNVKYYENNHIILTNQEYNDIYDNIKDLKEISLMLGSVIVDQNKKIDDIEINIEQTTDNHNKASIELKKTISYQRRCIIS